MQPSKLTEFINQVREKFEQAARIEILESLPKNAVGKLAKRELRDRLWAGTRKV